MRKQFAFGLIVTTILCSSQALYAVPGDDEKDDRRIPVKQKSAEETLEEGWMLVGDPQQPPPSVNAAAHSDETHSSSSSAGHSDFLGTFFEDEEESVGQGPSKKELEEADALLKEFLEEDPEEERLKAFLLGAGDESDKEKYDPASILAGLEPQRFEQAEKDPDDNSHPAAETEDQDSDSEAVDSGTLTPATKYQYKRLLEMKSWRDDDDSELEYEPEKTSLETPILTPEMTEASGLTQAISPDTSNPYFSRFEKIREEIDNFHPHIDEIFSLLSYRELGGKAEEFRTLAEKVRAIHTTLDELQVSQERTTETELEDALLLTSLIESAREQLVRKESAFHNLVSRFHHVSQKKGYSFSIPDSEMERTLEKIKAEIGYFKVPIYVAGLFDEEIYDKELYDKELEKQVRALVKDAKAIHSALDELKDSLQSESDRIQVALTENAFLPKESELLKFLERVKYVAEKRGLDFSTLGISHEDFEEITKQKIPEPLQTPTPEMEKVSGSYAFRSIQSVPSGFNPRCFLRL